jgi:hypothetical protein
MPDDPRVRVAISARGREPGLNHDFNHLGVQAEDKTELDEVYARLKAEGAPVTEQGRPSAATRNAPH